MAPFWELTGLLVVTTCVSALMKLIKQPLVVGYILAGILVGPSFLNIVHDVEMLHLFSKFGITILLFIVGIHLSPKVIREVGKVSLITGVGQVLVTSTLGFIISLFLGLDRVAALYVSIALTFSSTIIVLKLLSDRGDIQSLYGKIAIGFLLVQDIIATLILIAVSSVASSSSVSIGGIIALTFLKGAGLFVGVYLISRWLLPKMVEFAASSSELLFLFSIAWGLGFAYIFNYFGLSIEIGALIAGVSLSSNDFAEEISSRLRPLRDFFITLFFVTLGSEMILTTNSAVLIPVIIFSLFVLIGNPIIMIIIMNLLGYHKKTGYMAGLTVAQISEFSLILATLGMSVGHISKEVLTIITLVGLLTIAGSSYMILYADKLYPVMSKILAILEIKKHNKTAQTRKSGIDVYLFGFNRVGNTLLSFFKKQGYVTGIVDFDPAAKERLETKHKNMFYGDAGSVEFLDELQFDKTKLIVSTVTEFETNMTLTKYVTSKKPSIIAIIFAQTAQQAIDLYAAGAAYVILPHFVGANHTISLITAHGFNPTSFKKRKNKHLNELLPMVEISEASLAR